MDLSKSYDFFQPEKNHGRIHIVGCGSVGSTIAENLARYGVTKFTLWDFDRVEPHNLANQMFRLSDIGKTKVEALRDLILEINPDAAPDIKLKPEGWDGQQLSGFVFLAVDNIDLRREIVETNFDNLNIKAMFDFRTRLEDAQHYAANWMDLTSKRDFLATMAFTHDEAKAETPVSACNVELGVCATVRVICALGVANFVKFWNGEPLKKMVLADISQFMIDAF